MSTVAEVKMVSEFPAIAPSQMPTVAIIATMFCEKMAVDAMLESQITYIKHAPEASSPGK